jgi:hypothetical protein
MRGRQTAQHSEINLEPAHHYHHGLLATLTWWKGLWLFDVKKADERQSEIK